MSSNPFVDLSTSLARFTDAMEDDLAVDWTSTSPAAQESRHEPYAGEWGQWPARDAVIGVKTLGDSALSHLRALAQVIVTDRIVYPMFTVARGALEVAAQAHNLAEPDIGAEERIRRHMNMRLVSYHEQRFLVNTFIDGPYGDAETVAKLDFVEGRISRVLRAAGRHGFEVTPEPKQRFKAPYIGKEPPGALTVIEGAVSESNPTLGAVFWRYLSAIAHGTEYGLAGFMTDVGPTADPRQGDRIASIQVDAKTAARYLFAAPLSVISMVLRARALFGVDVETVKPDMRILMEVWGRVADIPFPDPTAS